MYEDRFYEQRKGMPMGSPASPIMADIIMEVLLDTTLNTLEHKPKILTKYVDDIFAIVKRAEVENTLRSLNSFNRHIQFTVEKEKDLRLPYLDTLIIRQHNKLKIDWFQKPTASGRLVNFYSKHPRRIIFNTANNFINRVLTISDAEFHSKNKDKIINILKMNNFPRETINNLLENSTSRHMSATHRAQTEKIYKSMTYVPGFSERIGRSNLLDKEMYNIAPKCNRTVKHLFSKTKSKINKDEKTNVVYKIPCNGDKSNICQKIYVGTTMNKLKTRLSSHKSDQKALHKPLEQKTAIAAHCTTTGHTPNFDKVEILCEENKYSRRLFQEMLHIINVPIEKRLNFKRDTEQCAHIYRHTIDKFGKMKTKIS